MKLTNADVKIALAAIVDDFKAGLSPEDRDSLNATIDAAMDSARKEKTGAENAKSTKRSTWKLWVAVAQTFARLKASPGKAKAVLMTAMPEGDTLAANTIDAYMRKSVDLVSVFSVPPEEYEEVFAAAGLKDADGKPVPPTMDITVNQAQAIIKAYKHEGKTDADILAESIALIVSTIKDIAKVDSDRLKEEETKAAKEALKATAIAKAQRVCRDIAVLLRIKLPVLDEQEAEEELPDITSAEAVGLLGEGVLDNQERPEPLRRQANG